MDPNLAVQQKKSSVGIFWIYFLILLAAAFGISGYFIGSEQASNKKSATSALQPQPPLSTPGLIKAQSLIKSGTGVLTKTQIIQIYTGRLKDFVPDKSWSVENKENIVTINNESGNKIKYFTRPGGWKGTSIAAETTPILKTGDAVMIETSFLVAEGRINIDRITLILLPIASPSSSLKP